MKQRAEDLMPCPVCGSKDLDTCGSMFSEFYGHEHIDSVIECNNCRFEICIPSNTELYPCSCCYGNKMDEECVRIWQSIPRREDD